MTETSLQQERWGWNESGDAYCSTTAVACCKEMVGTPERHEHQNLGQCPPAFMAHPQVNHMPTNSEWKPFWLVLQPAYLPCVKIQHPFECCFSPQQRSPLRYVASIHDE
ncbi:hypothetical protein PCASD_01170 [Puccinia coronata f. sp. avenae]|uniref:Uncharacterized protein n=1 Tax=Puccinia coronata f. sp. avenae TaxID=200324 RepID=A0A2N5VLF4_9BASI|nr:hypothetical protein PCASD_11017 [Puccinia coronata f. sp. avenae]PLW50829.1 hypothetical protein PCASD_01170 [Puccinia coronata f. sp. avenae]